VSADDVPRCPGCSSPLCEDCRGPLGATCRLTVCSEPVYRALRCQEHYESWRASLRTGPSRADWTGAQPTYRAMHKRVERARGKASTHQCASCPDPARQWSYDETDPAPIEGTENGSTVRWSTDVERYRPLCLSCHKRTDNRVRRDEGRWNPRPLIGTANPRAKLTTDQVREIRRRAAAANQRLNVSALSREFGVCRGSIDRVLDGRSYRDVA